MTAKASAWARLPEELKQRAQWAVAGASKAPLTLDASGNMVHASVTEPQSWMAFDRAAQLAYDNRDTVTTHVDARGRTVTQTGMDIGYILSADDPFTCIDLDVKDAQTHPGQPELWTPRAEFERYIQIYSAFNSYTERSRSGKGLHIWVRGDIGAGYRRDGVEVYSRERFIISTGDVLHGFDQVQDRQRILSEMIQLMSQAREAVDFKLVEVEQEEDDWSILKRASEAVNSEKFYRLWRGEWDVGEFPSQSEADLALMSMFTFYSESNEQCRRLFRQSGLGKRDKAQRDNKYIDRTLKLVRAREARERIAADAAAAKAEQSTIATMQEEAERRRRLADEELARMQGGVPARGTTEETQVTSLHVLGQPEPVTAPSPGDAALAQLAPVSPDAMQAGESGLPWPPGFAGAIARFIYGSAPRPVKEVAIVSALGLLAGICGKAWHIPQSGLNLYVILIARSAIGKEAMHSGIGALIRSCSQDNHVFHKFVDFTEYASGPALIKACVANPCFVNVSGEWGRRLKRLAAEDGRDGPLQTLRTQMTNLYQKSGPQAIVGGIGYSSTDNNVASVAGVSYSMIGETTPSTFYEALTESMMEDGFLSRFLVIEYDGERPAANPSPVLVPDQMLKQALNNLAAQADLLIMKDSSQAVYAENDASEIMNAFEKRCDAEINGTQDESRRQMWNRAALKSLRIAGLLAVGDNWMTPCITRQHILWAQDLVLRDISIMQRRLNTGDVGSGDNARERKLVALLRDYIASPVAASYKIPEEMRSSGIVPRSYLQVRINRSAAFYNHKLGATKALDDSINAMIANGYLMEVDKAKAIEAYGYQGRAFRITRLPDYDEQSKSKQ